MDLNKSVLGKYIPKDTFIHKMDARVKLFLMIVLMVVVFMSYGTYVSTFIINGLILILLFGLLCLAKINIGSIFSSLKVLWMTMIFLLIINTFIPNGNYTYVIFDAGNGFKIYLESFLQSFKIILRIMLMITLTLILTATTKPTDLSFAFEWYFTPLKFFRFPVAELAMIISLALRFIPTILEETNRIKKAQESRGVDFEHGKISNRMRAMISLIVPLFISTFSRSLDLAEALEARGYVPNETRTRYQIHKFSYRDLIAGIIICVVSAGFFFVSYYQFDILNVCFNFQNAITMLK